MFRLLCITAHPDDEAAGFGGSLLLARDRGIETFIICLTPGQAATHRGGAQTDEELSEMRRREFAASCEHLRVTEGIVLDYPDGKLDKQDFYKVVGDLTKRIRQIRPQVVLTFGPEGGITAHPDHSMAGIFATSAFHWAARTNRYSDQFYESIKAYQPQKLYHTTTNFTLPERQPVSMPPATAVIDISAHLERKIEAFKKHTSQSPLFELFESHVRPRGNHELFHLSAASKPRKLDGAETDLWEDVEDTP